MDPSSAPVYKTFLSIGDSAIAEAAVVPSPDPLRLAVPKAYVLLAAGASPGPELAQDIMFQGIHLTGGGALLRGMTQRLADATAVPVHLVAIEGDVLSGLSPHSQQVGLSPRGSVEGPGQHPAEQFGEDLVVRFRPECQLARRPFPPPAP